MAYEDYYVYEGFRAELDGYSRALSVYSCQVEQTKSFLIPIFSQCVPISAATGLCDDVD